MNNHEETIIRTFFRPEKRERYLTLFGNKKRREAVLDDLNHFTDFDSKYVTDLKSNTDILALLRQKGAPETCYVISDCQEIDGQEIPLAEALKKMEAIGWGTIVGCVPGRLAYYYGEHGESRILLENKSC